MNTHNPAHTVSWDEATHRLTLTGTLQLMRKDYQPICDLLDSLLRRQDLPRLIIDMTRLQMLNSSGLNALSRFVLGMRARPATPVIFHGSRAILWHHKALANMKSFLPTAEIELH